MLESFQRGGGCMGELNGNGGDGSGREGLMGGREGEISRVEGGRDEVSLLEKRTQMVT